MKKTIAALFIGAIASLGIVFGAAHAEAAPCRLDIGNGQFAPCPPPLTDNSNAPHGGAAGEKGGSYTAPSYTPSEPSGDSEWSVTIGPDGSVTHTTPFDDDSDADADA